jgi:hypothetical protein
LGELEVDWVLEEELVESRNLSDLLGGLLVVCSVYEEHVGIN